MPQDKKFFPGKGMVPAGNAAGTKKETVPPKRGAPTVKPGAKKAVPPKAPKKK